MGGWVVGWLGAFINSEMSCQGRQHLAYTCNVLKDCLKLLLRNVSKIECHIQLRTDLPCRTICYVKELDELAVRSSFKPFGDIGHYRNGSTTNLIAKSIVFCKSSIPRKRIHLHGQFPGQFPNFQIFKILNSCHNLPFPPNHLTTYPPNHLTT